MPDKIYMLNAHWFKPDGGAERYTEYVKEVKPLIEAVGGKRLRSLVPGRALIGEFDADIVFFVVYPSWEAYKEFANGIEYHKIAYIREAAIERSIVVQCSRPEKPAK